jgi:methylthioribose-1-phosphate isomerase
MAYHRFGCRERYASAAHSTSTNGDAVFLGILRSNIFQECAVDFEKYDRVRAVRFEPAAMTLHLLDQRLLPQSVIEVQCKSVASVVEAIASLCVRGAPAIGIAAAYGVVISAHLAHGPDSARMITITADCAALKAARPTAVNLAWALARMQKRLEQSGPDAEALLHEAQAIHAEDLAANRKMGEMGASLLPEQCGVLTHCNTGSLACSGFGTALGVIRAGTALGKIVRVYASETRPWLQGVRLTSWELLQDGIPANVIADGAGAHFMQAGLVQWLIVGADRICANGDTANKIGTLAHACAAKQFGVKVMVVAPSSTVDSATAQGSDIHIEERSANELLEYAGIRVAASGVQAINPVFDVTPARLIDAIVTENRVHLPPFAF